MSQGDRNADLSIGCRAFLPSSYNPAYYTASSLPIDSGDTDADVIPANVMWNAFDTTCDVDRRTANPTGHYAIDRQGYPLNPFGRTGLRGRGILPRWAVNYRTHLVLMCSTNESKDGREIFKYLMKKYSGSRYYHLPSTWTTATDMSAVRSTLKAFLLDIYQKWNQLENPRSKQIDDLVDHLTFVSTAYIGKAEPLLDGTYSTFVSSR